MCYLPASLTRPFCLTFLTSVKLIVILVLQECFWQSRCFTEAKRQNSLLFLNLFLPHNVSHKSDNVWWQLIKVIGKKILIVNFLLFFVYCPISELPTEKRCKLLVFFFFCPPIGEFREECIHWGTGKGNCDLSAFAVPLLSLCWQRRPCPKDDSAGSPSVKHVLTP